MHSVTPESRGERILEGTSREGLRSQWGQKKKKKRKERGALDATGSVF